MVCYTKVVVKKQTKTGGIKMAELYYEKILVGEITTNKSLTVDEVLERIEFDEQEFITKHGFDDIDYNDFKLIY